VRPRPAQRPHPPLFIATNSEDSVLSAARLGFPTLTSFFTPLEAVQRRQRPYREAAVEAGRSPAEIDELQRQSWLMRVVHVAPDRDEALRATEPAFMGYQGKMARCSACGRSATISTPAGPTSERRARSGPACRPTSTPPATSASCS
jgi:alkanesulfonate monooxygenase SsuD/methylene tetrahydromethanopterin reductase-like flavin-dependent oxidoreductase (luciferase family)